MSGQSPWDLSLARYLVDYAARKTPPDLAARLQEEWLADLMVRRGAFSRIGFGLGCCWATRVIAREFGVAAAAAGGSPTSGERLLVGYGGFNLSGFSRRTTAIIVIVGLHVGIFYLYLTGFSRTIVTNPADPFKMRYIVQPRQPPQRTAILPPTIATTTVDRVPLPDMKFEFPPSPKAITVARLPDPSGVAPLPPTRIDRVPGGPGAGFPNTQDYYPPGPRRLGESGTSVVSVCVDPRGLLIAAPTLVTSSGVGQIDEGALRLAKAGSGHYRPTTEEGRAVSSCYAFRVRFQLEDQ